MVGLSRIVETEISSSSFVKILTAEKRPRYVKIQNDNLEKVFISFDRIVDEKDAMILYPFESFEIFTKKKILAKAEKSTDLKLRIVELIEDEI